MNEKKHRILNILVILSLVLEPVFFLLSYSDAAAAGESTSYRGRNAFYDSTFTRPASTRSTSLDSPLESSFWGDVDGDHSVNGADLNAVSSLWNCATGDPCYDAAYDRDGNGIIDVLDLATLGNEYDVKPPEFEITAPLDGATVGSTTLEVFGRMSDTHAIDFISVNGITATVGTHAFTATVPISAGNQSISVVAADELGLNTGATLLIFVDQEGPFIRVNQPKDRQSVYTLRPTIAISYTDFYTDAVPGTLLVQLTDEDEIADDVTGLTVGDDEASGEVGFDLSEDKAYTLTASMQDILGNINVVQTTFFVPIGAAGIVPPDETEGTGWVSGVIYDSSTCDPYLTTCLGLPGANVTLTKIDETLLAAARNERARQLASAGRSLPPEPSSIDFKTAISGTAVSGPDGFFAFPINETGRYAVEVEKDGFTNGQRIVEIVRQHSTPVNEIYLTPLDPAVTACTETGCSHTSSDGELEVEIPPGAIPAGQTADVVATEFDRVVYLPSGELPPGTWETYAYDVGGGSVVTFTQPVTVRIKNDKNFPPGTQIPLGFWNEELLQWEHTGISTVDPTGEWLEMQVTHFSPFDCNDPVTISDLDLDDEDFTQPDDNCSSGDKQCSDVTLRSGILGEDYSLPATRILGGTYAPSFRYDSQRADPSELIEIKLGVNLDTGVRILDYIQAELYIEGEKTDNFTFATSQQGRQLAQEEEIGHFRYLWDGRDSQGNLLPPGIYRYSVHVRIPYEAQYYWAIGNVFGGPPDYNRPTGVWTTATADNWIYGSVSLTADTGGKFGSGSTNRTADTGGQFGVGWTLAGMQRLYENEGGRILVDDGTKGSAEFYFPGKNLLLEGVRSGELTLDEVTGLHGMYVEEIGDRLSVNSDKLSVISDQSPGYGSPEPVVPFNLTGELETESHPLEVEPEMRPEDLIDEVVRVSQYEIRITQTPSLPHTLPDVVDVKTPVSYLITPAGVNVSGVITESTTWTAANSPYILTGDVVVNPAVTLTVEAGVVVKGQDYTELNVQGHLVSRGTITQPITYTSNTNTGPAQWSGLVFDSGTGDLRHVTVRYSGESNSVLGGSFGSNITVRDVLTGEVHIESSHVLDENDVSIFADYGLYVIDSQVVVSNTLFSGNGEDTTDFALYATGANTVITVTQNVFQNNAGWAVRVEANDAHQVGGNTFGGNGKDRVLIAGGAVAAGANLAPQTGLTGYELDDDVTVPAGVTLTMQPGTMMMGQEHTELRVLGHLQAIGSQPITFTSATDSGPAEWSGLVFDGGTGDLRHVTVRYGGDPNSILGGSFGSNIVARDVLTGEVRIESSRILDEHDNNSTIPDYGLYASNSNLVISDTLFSGNGEDTKDYALYATGANTVITVTGNVFQNNAGWAVRVEANDAHQVTGNTFSGNGKDRVLIAGGEVAAGANLAPQTGLTGYELDDDVTVPAGVTLTMQPGTMMMGQEYAELRVLGHLQAIGSQPITFTSATDSGPAEWSGLVFDGGTGELRHVTVRYGGDSNSVLGGSFGSNIVARDVLTGEVRIESSRILDEHDNINTFPDYGLYASNSNLVISDTLFYGNGDGAFDWPLRVEASDLHRIQLLGNSFGNNSNERVLVEGGAIADQTTLVPQTGLEGYELAGDLTVPSGFTLTLQPGTAVMGREYVELTVLGHLEAIGSKPITFTSATDSGPAEWSGLVFDGGTGELYHATVRYGGESNSVIGGLFGSNITVRDVLAGEVRIESSKILDEHDISSTYADYGLHVDNSRVVVSDTLFSNNGDDTNDYGIYVKGDSTVFTVTNSIFQSNPGYPLRLPAAALNQVSDNNFINNGLDRVRLYGDEILTADTSIAPRNGLSGYEFEGTMVVTTGVTLTVGPGTSMYWKPGKGLTVHGLLNAIGSEERPITFTSSADDGPGQWNGITFGDGVGELEHTTVRFATTGLSIDGGQITLRYASLVDNSTHGIHLTGSGNDFYAVGSNISDNGNYGLFNQTGVEVDARYNWWGHLSGPYHPNLNPGGQGNKVSDNVLFNPWLEESVNDLGIQNRTAADDTILTYETSSDTYTRLYPDGTVVHFNPDGTHDYTLDYAGIKTSYAYNLDGTLASIGIIAPGESDPNWTWTFSYSGGRRSTNNGQRTITINDPAGHVTTLEIDEHDNLTSFKLDAIGSAHTFAYDSAHRMTHNRNELGDLTTYVYDEYGRIDRVELPPRQVYDPTSGEYNTINETRDFTPSDVSYQMVNKLDPGDPLTPNSALITGTMLIDQVDLGRGGYQAHTNLWGGTLDQTDALGRVEKYQRSETNLVTRLTEPDGDCTEYTYDENQNMLSQSLMGADQCALDTLDRDPAQVATRLFTYEPRFNMPKTETDPLGYTTVYTYDHEVGKGNLGLVIAIQYPPAADEYGVVDTPIERYAYNSWGLLQTFTDTLGIVNCYVYSQGTPDEAAGGGNPLFAPGVDPVPGHLTQEILDCGGLNQTVTYRQFNASGDPQLIEGPGDEWLNRLYDYDGRVISETNAVTVTNLYQYDPLGRQILSIQDAGGRNITTTYTYDAEGKMLNEYTDADGLSLGTTNAYDVNGNRVLMQDGLGNTTRYFYDDANQLTQIIDPAGHSITRTYALDGRLERNTDADGAVTLYEYDGLDRLVAEIRDDGGLNQTKRYTYDLNDNVLTTTDPLGAATCYEYDRHNRLTKEIHDCGGRNLATIYAYDRMDNLVYVTDPRGVMTHNEYDALNRLTRLTEDKDGLDLVTRYDYDLGNNLVQEVDERGVVTSYVYDNFNRLVKTCQDTLDMNLCTAYTYDSLNNLQMVTDPNGVATLVEYNAFGLRTQVVEDHGGLNATTSYEYDNALNLVRVVDANGNPTLYNYTPRNEMASEISADLTAVSRTYDGRGNVLVRTDQDDETISYEYDGLSRVTTKTLSTGGVQTFGYDPLGRMTSAGQSMNGHDSLLGYAYNPIGDVVSTTQTLDGQSWTVGYGYDYVGGVYTTTYPSGAQRVYETEALNRLDAVRKGDGSLVGDYDYFDLDSYSTLTYPNTTTMRTEYDALDRTTTISSTLADYRYGYDAAGNPTYMQRMHEAGQPADVYEYDNLYQVKQVWYGADATNPGAIINYDHLQWYDLDNQGNRLEVQDDGVPELYLPTGAQQLTNPMNRYEQVGASAFNYDLRGNTLVDGTNIYGYDILNRQIVMTGPGGNAEYIYDALGRRIAAVVDGVTTQYLYDIQYRVIEEYDNTRSLSTRYTYGSGLDEVLSMERGGDVYYYLRDALGSVTEISNAAGELVERYKYDIYGEVTIFNGGNAPLSVSAIGNPYLFTGRRYDPESGNYYYRARMYSPEIGRFLQTDPIGYTDSTNLYLYVHNRPTLFTDPDGLLPIKVGTNMNFVLGAGPIAPGVGWMISVSVAGEVYDCCNTTTNKVEYWGSVSISVQMDIIAGASFKNLKPTGFKKGPKYRDRKTGRFAKGPKRGDRGTGATAGSLSDIITGLPPCPKKNDCTGFVNISISAEAGAVFGLRASATIPVLPKFDWPKFDVSGAYVVGASATFRVEGGFKCDGKIGTPLNLF